MASQDSQQVTGGFIGAGAGGGLGLNAPGAGPKVQHFAGAKGKSGLGIPDELPDVWMRILNDSDPISWVVVEYDASGKNLALKATGEGGMSEFKAALGDGAAWGGFKCIAVDNRQNTTSRRTKIVFVQFMPDTAPAMRRAKMGSQKGVVKEVMHSAHLDLTVTEPNEIEENDLVSRLQAATGAHKPNGYEFEPGVVTSAEGFLNG